MARALGTRVHGVDLQLESTNNEAAAHAQFKRVQALLHQHGVVALGQQEAASRLQLHSFARRWGPVALHFGQGKNEHASLPGMLTINDGFSDTAPPPEPGATEFGPTWHLDFAACVRPGYATVLCCQETPVGALPEERCDTKFVDTVTGYDSLSETEQHELQGLKVRVSYRSSAMYPEIFDETLRTAPKNQNHRRSVALNLTNAEREAMKGLRQDVEHPLVRNVLGRPALFFGQVDTSFIVSESTNDPPSYDDMVRGHGQLKELQARVISSQAEFAHQWVVGDVVIWDNRQVMHMADYIFARSALQSGQRRIMWHVATKDPVRPQAWDPRATGPLLTPVEPATDQWQPADEWVARL
jgi:taurine dioxygenase